MTVRLGTKLIANTGSGGSGGGTNVLVDNITITKDDTDVITTVAIDNKNNNSDIPAVKTWMGTLAEYEAIENKSNDIIYYITDDETLAQSANINLTNLTNNGEARLGDKRNIGEKVTSFLPVKDACLHLADGTLITYGIYKNFVDYMANLYSQSVNAQYFVTEDVWQNTVVTTGECDRFVYDGVNKTVRLPKVNGVYLAIATLVKTPTEVSMDEVITEFDNKASVDLDNLSGVGQAKFDEKADKTDVLNKSQITNCLLEVPQNIKLELTDGTLTLKAGSKVIVPNGVGVFNEVTITTDIECAKTGGSGQVMITVRYDGGMGQASAISNCKSGAGISAEKYSAIYDTTANTVYRYSSDTTAGVKSSLPIAICTQLNDVITSIDQVFNGIGYIGSTLWVDKGVKGLVSNGRNKDGSLKNEEWETSSVITRTFASNQNFSDAVIALNPNEPIAGYKIGMFGKSNFGYKELENKNWNIGSDTEWRYTPIAFSTFTNGVISNFQPKQLFRAVDYSDSSTVSGWSMPSSKYTDLTLGASGATYTAPANGYYLFCKYALNQVENIGISKFGYLWALEWAPVAKVNLFCWVPVQKGETIAVSYNASGETRYFRFYYAEGEV